MKYLSLFSGIEAATLAWEPLGWEPVAFSEIEAFPCAVLQHHWPHVPNLGDVTAITEKQIKQLGRIDLVVFGSPCQDLSVAGKRKGFDGERSSLFRDAIRIVRWAVKHNGCRFALWENVPGAFTSNQGADFCEVLCALSGSKQQQPQRWGGAGCCFGKTGLVEWATLDAKYFGVPQRRRRLFALADFGDWTSRTPILSQSDSVCGHTAPSQQTETTVAATTATGVRAGSHWDDRCNPHPTLNQSHNAGGIAMSNQELFSQRGGGLVPYDMTAIGEYGTGRLASTCKARDYKDPTDLIVHGSQDNVLISFSAKGCGGDATDNLCPTIRAGSHNTSHANSGSWPAIAFNPVQEGMGLGEVAPPIGASEGGGNQGAVLHQSIVRRLTPIECERLQGMPDNHTRIAYRNKTAVECPDGPRYKAIGNSMAVPVVRWIGEQIQNELGREHALHERQGG